MTDPHAKNRSPIKAVCFDFMGTCLDWHHSITATLPQELTAQGRSDLALEWRQTYFDANTARLHAGLAPEDIDLTHRRTLQEVLTKPEHHDIQPFFTDDIKDRLVAAWHQQPAWDDVADALKKLRDRGWEIFVHANGTTRLQLDLCQFSGLKFDMLFSSELLGVYKPALENYERALKLIKRKPEECVLVAAHAYDLRGAKAAGIRTVYVYRWTDDIEEDQEKIKSEFDHYLMNMTDLDVVISRLE